MLAMYFAAACSFPGGFVVLIFTNSTSQSCASRANALVFPTTDSLGGIPIAEGAWATCARRSLASAKNTNTTNTAAEPRFQLKKHPQGESVLLPVKKHTNMRT
jgi:hypothetical protein